MHNILFAILSFFIFKRFSFASLDWISSTLSAFFYECRKVETKMENVMVWNLLPWHQVMLRMLRDCVSAKIKIFQVSLKSRHQEIKPNMKLLQNVEYIEPLL